MRKYLIYMTVILLLLMGVVVLLYTVPLLHLRFEGIMWMVILPWLLTLVCGMIVCRKANNNPVQFVSLFLAQLGVKFLFMILLLTVSGLLFRAHIRPALLTLFFAYILFTIAEYVWVFRRNRKSRKDRLPTQPNCS